jgi:hypothetical protein
MAFSNFAGHSELIKREEGHSYALCRLDPTKKPNRMGHKVESATGGWKQC